MKDVEIDSTLQPSPQPLDRETYFAGYLSLRDEIDSRNSQYIKLCSRFLPVHSEESIWRYCPSSVPSALEQGWKLHISATILTANEIFGIVAPFLNSLNARFKAPASLFHLKNLNTGIVHGYSQIGKFIVIYPQSDDEAVFLAERLHRLTSGFSAPRVPFDLRYKPGSCVYYRYGSFKKHRIENEDGSDTFVIRDPDGNFVPDLRDVEGGKPDWIINPFPAIDCSEDSADTKTSPFTHTYKVFRALSQRGKGGVYEAIDLSGNPPRLCIVKEGRQDGETDWDGRDGFLRIQHEEKMLKILASAGVKVPRVFTSFKSNDSFYLILESIEGQSLQEKLQRRRRRLSVSQIIRLGLKIAGLIAEIHSQGIVWRDLKPKNLFITENETFRALDFEGACRIDEPDLVFWGTPAFLPIKTNEISIEQAKPALDLYALGVVFYLLIEGKLPEPSSGRQGVDVKIKRRNVPAELSRIVARLLDFDAEKRPTAKEVCETLKKVDIKKSASKSMNSQPAL